MSRHLKHLGVTVLLCLAPYAGFLLLLVVLHRPKEIIEQPSWTWVWAVALVSVTLPLGRLIMLGRLLSRRAERFQLSLLLQLYLSLIVIFASFFGSLQLAQAEPAFLGMSHLWDPALSGTFGSHLSRMNQIAFEAIYLSVITITNVGFGDIAPVSNTARLLVMLEALCGVGFMGVALGHYFSSSVVEKRPKANSEQPRADDRR